MTLPTKTRRGLTAATALLFALLALFPRPYVGRAVIVPYGGAGKAPSTFGTLGAHTGEQAQARLATDPVAIATVFARSAELSDATIGALGLVGEGRSFHDIAAARGAIAAMVDVHPLAGGMIEVVVVGPDAPLTLAVTQSYLSAIAARIAPIGGRAVVADPPHLEPARQFNVPAVALLGLLALLAFLVECRTHLKDRPEGDQ